jgi:hypothetical protein
VKFFVLVFLFCALHITKQFKANNTKLTSSPTKTQHADAAVSNDVNENEYIARYSESDTTQNINRHEYRN